MTHEKLTTPISERESFSGPIALVFPGQGSQSVGMGKDLFGSSKAARAVFEEVDDALGVPLTRLILEGPEDALKETINLQPAIMAVSLACVKAMEETLGKEQPKPTFLAGHSLGEYTALTVAGVFGIADATRLVRERGRLMSKACKKNPGGMAALMGGIDEGTVEEICQQTGAEIANINSNGQIVISGDRKALAIAMDLSKARGARKVIGLSVSGAFHSSLMEPAATEFARYIEGIKFEAPEVPIISNVTAKPLNPAEIKMELATQITNRVRWKQSIEAMRKLGVNTFIEIGPGKVLTGFIRDIAKEAKIINVNSLQSIKSLSAGAV